MANINSMAKLKNTPSRNGFDLSRKFAFSAKVGELLPVECIECIPGDSFQINVQHFTRTMPVQTSAFTRMREYYDWFFVPSNLIWDKFNTFVTQMDKNNTKAKSIRDNFSVGKQHPYFSFMQLESYLRRLESNPNKNLNIFGYKRNAQTAKLLDYLGYGDHYKSVGYASASTPSIETADIVLNPFPLLAYQKIYQDYFRNSQWEDGYAPACNINYVNGDNLNLEIENIDLDAENMFDLRYANWNKDYFMGVLPNSQYGDAASVDLSTLVSNPFETEPFYIHNANQANQNVQTDSARYLQANGDRNWIIPASQISKLSTAMGLSADNLRSAFTILALRQAEAHQKWAEITQSNQQDYKAQIEAHFGVHVSDALSDRCTFIDGGVSTLDIDEVTNTNLADGQATIGGKGIGTGSANINFSTDVHGYLMCIYHCKPLLDYQVTGIKRRNLKTYVTDYAIPEYDKTGMVSIPFIELISSHIRSGDNNPITYRGDELLGYATQYYEYKTSYDEVKGAFVYGGLNDWVAPFDNSYLQEYLERIYDSLGTLSLTYHWFKIPPSVLNPIFVGQIESGPDIALNGLEKDQLLVNTSFDIKAVRNLDYNGLPY